MVLLPAGVRGGQSSRLERISVREPGPVQRMVSFRKRLSDKYLRDVTHIGVISRGSTVEFHLLQSENFRGTLAHTLIADGASGSGVKGIFLGRTAQSLLGPIETGAYLVRATRRRSGVVLIIDRGAAPRAGVKKIPPSASGRKRKAS